MDMMFIDRGCGIDEADAECPPRLLAADIHNQDVGP
jgi:hypothetical protein